MRKRFILILIFALSLFITGCKGTDTKPVIEGAEDLSISEGVTFDEMDGITATDVEDGDLTDSIEVEGTINTSTVGEQTITYIIEDSDGNVTSVEITITILEAVVDDYPEILGVENVEFIIGSDSTILDGVTATDAEDGDITDDIATTTGNFDINEIGVYLINYSITDSYGNITLDSRFITVAFDDEPWELNNSEFDFEAEGWNTDFINTATGTFEVVDGVLEMNVTDIGANFYDVRVFQDEKEIDMDTLYKIEFTVKADVARTIRFVVVDTETSSGGLLTDLIGEEILFDITTEWVTYEYIYNPSISLDTVRFALLLGNITGAEAATTVYIDDFSTAVYVDEPYEIINPDFNLGEYGWKVGAYNNSEATYEVVDGVLIVDITYIGTMFYDIVACQSDKEIDMDTMYLITFRAKVDVERPIRLGIVDTETVVAGHLDTLVGEVIFDLTTEWVVYEYIFDPDVSLDTVRFAILMGNITGTDAATKVYIDYFVITEYIPN